MLCSFVLMFIGYGGIFFPRVDFDQIIQQGFGLFDWDSVEKDPTFDLELLVTIVWGLWNKRNSFIHNGEQQDPWMVVDEARALV